jgi:hypothetical protein
MKLIILFNLLLPRNERKWLCLLVTHQYKEKTRMAKRGECVTSNTIVFLKQDYNTISDLGCQVVSGKFFFIFFWGYKLK